MELVSEGEYEGLVVGRIGDVVPHDWDHLFVFLADHQALSDPERPVLCVDLCDEPGRSFRVIPSEMWGIANNLSIANMGFESVRSISIGSDIIKVGGQVD